MTPSRAAACCVAVLFAASGACSDSDSDADLGVPDGSAFNVDGAFDAASADAPSGDGMQGADGSLPPTYMKLPCTVHVGAGSGTLTIDASTGVAGDVICVAAGSYSGGSIKNLTNRTVQNDGGLVTITGVVEIGGLVNVTLSGSGDAAIGYGFRLTGAQASMVITAHNSGLVVHDFEAIGAGIFLDAGHTNLMWSGDPSGFVLYQTLLDRIHLKQSGQLFQGNYGAISSHLNFASDVEMAHIVVEDSAGQGQAVVGGGGIFNMNVHDWTITSSNVVNQGSLDDRDTGVISLFGSGTFRRMHRNGGWGWLVRAFGMQLGAAEGVFRCEDNVDLNTEYYGTCEIRNDDTPSYLVPGTISTVEIFVQNNVSAHKLDEKNTTDTSLTCNSTADCTPSGAALVCDVVVHRCANVPGYTTAIALIPNLIAGTTATLKNNVGCDNANDYMDVDSLHFFKVDGTVVSSGNQELVSCAGLSDPITGLPL